MLWRMHRADRLPPLRATTQARCGETSPELVACNAIDRRRRASRRVFGALILVTALSASTAAAAQSTTISIDFVAVTSDGQPATGLKAEDVQIKIESRTRPIKSLEFITVAASPAAESAPANTPSVPMPPPFGSNAASEGGRAFVIAIEDDSFRPGRERPLRSAVDRFLAALTPRDHVALVTMPYGGVRVSPTNDFEKVRTEVAKVGGQGTVNESGSDMACRTRRTLESLVGLVSGFAGADGSTTVLFVTSGMAAPRRDAVMTAAPGMCELKTDLFEQVGAAAGAGRANFYIIQPEDVIIKPAALAESIAGADFTGSSNPMAGIEHLAGVTGATRLYLAATGDNTLMRVARETSAYYVATVEVQPADRNGASRRLDIRAGREGVTIHGRPNITFPKPDSRTPTKAQSVTPRTMLREGRTFRDLPLRGIGYVSNNPGDDRLKIVCMMEPADQTPQLSAAAAGLFDPAGRLVAQWTADAKNLAATPVIGALLAKPGTYRLRVAATDAAGRSGSVDYELPVELTSAGPLRLSSLVLGLSREGTFVPRMLFGAEPVAIGYFDAYGRADAISVTTEVARSVNGPALGAPIPGSVKPVSGEDRHIGTVAIPIGGLPSGDYVIRVTITAAGQPSGRLVRTLRKQ
jgi:VWFA-related protein